ncbi:MAG: DUF4440 domain-containing protein [Candidatus Krumholzibacteria bacterium]|nr:DUF4440 domain-containing protein [Candidatus Krumholzibacteria bacterium]
MARWHYRWVLLLLALAAGCGGASTDEPRRSDSKAIEDQLIQADRDFAQATAERRLDGWMSYFAEDAAKVIMNDQVIRGWAEIRLADSLLFADPGRQLVWDPTDAGGFVGTDVGFTTGRYQLLERGGEASQDTLSQGTYLTIWRRIDGKWRVILDTGVADRQENK